MEEILNILRNNLELNGFHIVQTTNNRIIIFRSFSKYTKCIYINLIDSNIEIKIDKVFDVSYFYRGIERLLISKKTFNQIEDGIEYIQSNIIPIAVG